MKTNYAQILLKDHETIQILKEMILEKKERYEALHAERGRYLYENGHGYRNEFGQWFYTEVYDQIIGGPEMRRIERDLGSMCIHLDRAEGRMPEQTTWEKQYQYATKEIQIKTVAQHFLGTQNFKRNIQCPFHKDRNPSFKIYSKSNRFVCFSCGSRGSPIDFVMQYENCSFKEAVSIISNL